MNSPQSFSFNHQLSSFSFFLSLFLLTSGLASCQEHEENRDYENMPVKHFGPVEDLGELDEDAIEEASGLAHSRTESQGIWVHNDSGNDPELFLISHKAQIMKTYLLEGIENRDWEDICIGPGPEDGLNYIYLGEIGDNLTIHNTKYIYRFREPAFQPGQSHETDTIKNIDAITIQYPGSTQNAEAMMIDPLEKDIYIIAKNQDEPAIYLLPFEEQNTQGTKVLEKKGVLNIKSESPADLITAADISPDGMEILVKTYGAILYWKRDSSQTSISDLLQTTPDSIAYVPEPQGEAIAFTPDGDGFFTVSEKNFGMIPHLFFYPRK